MLKKIFYFGVGLASVLYDNFDELARSGEERYSEFVRVNQSAEETIEVESEVSVETNTDMLDDEPDLAKPDDLTAISGIGPTFARRLQEAGITTYAALAASTEDQIKEITRVAEWQANPHDWIIAAEAMA